MVGLQTDLRVIRTKKSIRDALIELIKEKGFESITVKDITTKANINRGTFYSHYQDKFDLMDRCEEEFMNDMAAFVKNNFQNIANKDIGEESTVLSINSVAASIFEYIGKNKPFLKAILGPKGDLSFHIKFKDFMSKALLENNQTPFVHYDKLLVPSEFLMAYLISAHMGVMQQWLNTDNKYSHQEIAQILSTITLNGPLYAAGLKK